MSDRAIVIIAAIICSGFSYAVFSRTESKEEAGVMSLAAIISPSIALFQLDVLSFNPLQRYTGAYAALGTIAVGLIAEDLISTKVKPSVSERVYEVTWFFLVFGAMVGVGLFLWAYDPVIGLPVAVYVAFIPGFWIFYRMLYGDDLGGEAK